MEGRVAAAIEEARELGKEALGAWRGSEPDYALSVCDRALELLRPYEPSETLADVLRWKGSVLRDCGQHTAASDAYAESLAVADKISYRLGRAHALNCFGTIAQCRGELRVALRWYREAQQAASALDDKRLLGMIEQNFGVVAELQGRTDAAVQHFLAALAAFEDAGDQRALIWVLNNLGVLYTRSRAYDLAAPLLDRALRLASALADVASQGIAEENRANLFLATGKFDDAEEAATRALGVASQRSDRTRMAAALCIIGRLMRIRDGMSSQVVATLDRALKLCTSGEDLELKLEILRELAYATDNDEQELPVVRGQSYSHESFSSTGDWDASLGA